MGPCCLYCLNSRVLGLNFWLVRKFWFYCAVREIYFKINFQTISSWRYTNIPSMSKLILLNSAQFEVLVIWDIYQISTSSYFGENDENELSIVHVLFKPTWLIYSDKKWRSWCHSDKNWLWQLMVLSKQLENLDRISWHFGVSRTFLSFLQGARR